MKTLHLIVSSRKKQLVEGLNEEDKKWILQSLVNVALGYKLSGNIGMFNHVVYDLK